MIVDLTDIRLADENFWLSGGSSSAGGGLSGRSQVFVAENRVWRADLTVGAGTNPVLNARLKGIGQRAWGRAGRLRFRICNAATIRARSDETGFLRSIGVSSLAISEGFLRHASVDGGPGPGLDAGSTITGYALPDMAEPVLRRSTHEGSREMVLDGFLGRNISVDAYLSVNDFLHQVESNDDGELIVNPPLRRDIPAGATVDVSRPTILMRLESDDGWAPHERHRTIIDAFSVRLVEAFER